MGIIVNKGCGGCRAHTDRSPPDQIPSTNIPGRWHKMLVMLPCHPPHEKLFTSQPSPKPVSSPHQPSTPPSSIPSNRTPSSTNIDLPVRFSPPRPKASPHRSQSPSSTRPQNSFPAAHRRLGMLRTRPCSSSRLREGRPSASQPPAGALTASAEAPNSFICNRQSF